VNPEICALSSVDLGHIDPDVPFVILENTESPERAASYLFTEPAEEVICTDHRELSRCFEKIRALQASKFHLCGYLSYELGDFLLQADGDPADQQHNIATPLLHFYAFRSRRVIRANDFASIFAAQNVSHLDVNIRNLELDMTEASYQAAIARIQRYQQDGETYQVNFTQRYAFEFLGSNLELYAALRTTQAVQFSAFLNFPEATILSLSPELFLEKRGSVLTTRPIKGTIARDHLSVDESQLKQKMTSDPKLIAENLMIVDLMRNDLGRIARKGSVQVSDLFDIETLETLHQMVTTIRAEIHPQTCLESILRALFPCGSITGAPKIRTMEIIRELETSERGVYTGAIGYLEPGGDFCFNVPIRTVTVEQAGIARMGVGGGIVYDSDAQQELEECRTKGRFLRNINRNLSLFETMRFDAHTRSIALLNAHLDRLRHSAQVLSFEFNEPELRKRLEKSLTLLDADAKVKIILNQNGAADILTSRLTASSDTPSAPWICMSPVAIDSQDWRFQYKTTRRTIYDEQYDLARGQGFYDTLFKNEKGLVTEASRHNIFIEIDDVLITPPVEDGLLPGVYRQAVIDDPSMPTQVRSITESMLRCAKRIYLTNALRGMIEVKLRSQ